MNKKLKLGFKIKDFNDITPILTFLVVVVFFGIATGGRLFTPYNFRILIDQSITTLVAGLGMIFVISLGGTDITPGAVANCGGFAAFLLGARYGILVAFVSAILIGAASGLIVGVVNARFKVPSFMTSLAVGPIALRGIANVILQNQETEVIITPELVAINSLPVKLPITIVLLIIILYLFHYSPFGYYCRAIGENESAVRYTGVNVKKIKILAFLISGVMAGFATVFMVSRAGGLQSSLGTGFEMNVMMAIFVAGVPVTGGMGTKIYKLLLGAFTLLVLQTGMVLCGLSGSTIQLVRGIVLLTVVYLSVTLNNKGPEGFKGIFSFKKKKAIEEA